MNKQDNQLIKLEVKLRKKQNRDFKRLYQKAVKTIRRLNETKPTKQALINDLLECNNIEIMHYLGVINPSTKAEYIFAINKLLEMESESYDYQYTMVYSPGVEASKKNINDSMCLVGGFAAITEHIRKHHKYVDLKNKITNISEG
jgi:hypothetical protein